MARTYKLLDRKPHPANPLNITTTVEVTDDATGEIVLLKDRIFGSDLTASALQQQIGLIEANVMGPRAVALAELAALIQAGGVVAPIPPVVVGPNPKQVTYDRALQALAELDRLVTLNVIPRTATEYTDALAAARAAKAAL